MMPVAEIYGTIVSISGNMGKELDLNVVPSAIFKTGKKPMPDGHDRWIANEVEALGWRNEPLTME